MAFINKLFSSRKKANAKHQDNVCDKLFSFSNDQVRVVLFQECDFRGRKLLFDSSAIEKVPLEPLEVQNDKSQLNLSFRSLSEVNVNKYDLTASSDLLTTNEESKKDLNILLDTSAKNDSIIETNSNIHRDSNEQKNLTSRNDSANIRKTSTVRKNSTVLADSKFTSEANSRKSSIASITTSSNKKYKEISNGFGYICNKPNGDTSKLGEMIFGSVAMSYRGTSYKIHSLALPSRLMCTKVFPSPRHARGTRNSAPTNSSTSSQSLDHSIKFEDSGASCATSCSDPISVHSTTSETLLVCREPRSVPLDVPLLNGPNLWSNIPNNSENISIDSVCGGDQSCSSVSSGPNSGVSDGPVQGSKSTFSSGSLYKRWLRSASTSLEYSTSSLTGSASADECYTRPNIRTIKLGLAIIVQLSDGQEQNMEQFFMEHAALVEAMVSRARQGTEIAYLRHVNFLSLMMEVANTASQWLVNLLSGPQLNVHLWLSWLNSCDNLNSIRTRRTLDERDKKYNLSEKDKKYILSEKDKEYILSERNDSEEENRSELISENNKSDTLSEHLGEKNKIPSDVKRTSSFKSCKNTNLNMSASDLCSSYESTSSSDFVFLNFTRFFKGEWEIVSTKKTTCSDGSNVAEKFVRELCELLETIDVKHTNFFLSTLITAVLTHHLGWVSTVLPSTSNDETILSKLPKTCNPLWGQLTDLFGAIGNPTKVAHTIVNGSNKSETVAKILNVLTYFIRCCEVERKNLSRTNIDEENQAAYVICQENSCIPKESFKKFEDHLREIEVVNNKFTKITSVQKDESESVKISLKKDVEAFVPPLKSLGFKKTATCFSDLTKLIQKDPVVSIDVDSQIKKHPEKENNNLLDKVQSLGLQICNEKEVRQKSLKLPKLSELPKEDLIYLMQTEERQNLIDIREAREQIEKVFSPKRLEKSKNVEEFVFGKVQSELLQQKPKGAQQKSEDIKLPQKSDDLKSRPTVSKLEKDVIFVLGDNEELIGLKKLSSNSTGIKLKKNFNPLDKLAKQEHNESLKGKLSESIKEKHDEELLEKETNNAVEKLLRGKNEELIETDNNLVETDIKPVEKDKKLVEKDKKSIEKDKNPNEKDKKLMEKDKNPNEKDKKPTEKDKKYQNRPTTLNLSKRRKFYSASSDSSINDLNEIRFFKNSLFKDDDFIKYKGECEIKPSSSWSSLSSAAKINCMEIEQLEVASGLYTEKIEASGVKEKEFVRSQSVPPEPSDEAKDKDKDDVVKSKYRYSGVKFNFQQYPQILPNYMRSKNIELTNLPFPEKAMKTIDRFPTKFDLPTYENCEYEEGEALQTPSNASELEYVSELEGEKQENGQGGSKIESHGSLLETSDGFVRTNESFVGTNGNFVGTNGNFVGTNGNFVGTNGSFVETNENFVETNGNFVETNGSFVGTNENLVRTNENFVETNGSFVGTNENLVRTNDGFVRTNGNFFQESDYLENSDFKSPRLFLPELKHTVSKVEELCKKEDFELMGCEKTEKTGRSLKIIELPMPRSIEELPFTNLPPGYTSTLMRGIGENYISDMILQGTCAPKVKWESLLKRDLILATRYPLLDQPVQEAVAIVANTDTWEVQLMSSHTYVIDRGSSGVRIGMSQLVANMLESLLHMWKAHMSPEYCLMHIEKRLQEFCVQSKALTQLLLETDFCSMELLTKSLHLEVNDIPLLMAIASTHSPELMQKYGLSFS